MPGRHDNRNNRQNSEMEIVDILTIATEPKATGPRPLNPENIRQPRAPKPADKKGWWWGTGRRKAAVARVRLKPAEGDAATITVIGVNKKKSRPHTEYFNLLRDQVDAVSPLRVTGTLGKMQVVCKCHGGGIMGQANAIKLGIARALRDYDPNLEQALRDNSMLTRDSRKVERKKYGQAGARRRFQFSKR